MTGRKTLREVRAELEAALGTGPTGDGAVAESLRRFLAAPSTPPLPPPGGSVAPGTGRPDQGSPAAPPV